MSAFAFALLFTAPAQAGALYVVTDLGTLGGTTSSAMALNNHSQIVGWSRLPSGDVRGVEYHLLDPSQNRELGTLEGGSTQADDISDSGVIVGTSRSANNGPHRAVIFDNDGPGTVRDIGNGFATAVNSAGHVVGVDGGKAILYDHTGGGNNKELGTLGGTPLNGSAQGINNAGQIVGSSELRNGDRHATLFDTSNPAGNKDLGFIGTVSVAVAINDHGQVAGSLLLENGESRAVLYNASNPGAFEIFDSLVGTSSNQAMAINNLGQVVGLSVGPDRVPWIYDPKTGLIVDLNTLIQPGDPLYGFVTITQANDINDRGQIVGQAFFFNAATGGEFHAVLLTSVPLPAALPLFLSAVFVLILMVRRRDKSRSGACWSGGDRQLA